MASLGNSTKYTKKNTYLSFSTYPKRLKRREHSPNNSMNPSSPWYQNQTNPLQKGKSQANIFDEYRCQNSPQNISKPNPTLYRKDHTEWSSGIYSRNVRIGQHSQINQCDRKNKNHMIISVDTEKHLKKFNIHSW